MFQCHCVTQAERWGRRRVVVWARGDEDDDVRTSLDAEDGFDVEGEVLDDDNDDDDLGVDSEFDLDAILGKAPDDDNVDIDEVFDRIGFKSVPAPVEGSSSSDEETLFSYPEPPKREIAFGDLLRKCGYDDEVIEQYSAVQDVKISGVQLDSRNVKPGDLFVCTEGANFNGHWFIPQALQNGAVLVLAKVYVPGADAALHTDAGPEDEEPVEGEDEAGEYNDVYWKLCAADAAVMEACGEALRESRQRVAALRQEAGLSEEEAETMELHNGMRIISSAMGHSLEQWTAEGVRSGLEDGIKADGSLTPHPLNPLVPMECTAPVVFAIDPYDFGSVLAAAFYERPSERMTTVAVTGTNGKTTIAWLMRSIFEEMGQLCGMLGTVEYALATDRLTLSGDLWAPDAPDPTLQRESSVPFWAVPYEGKYSVPCTTPDAISAQRLLAGMADRGATACVMEASSIGLDQGRLSYVDHDIAIFSNLTRDHLDYHLNEASYRFAKSRLFHALRDPARQRAIINLDDPNAQYMADAAQRVPVVTYSFSNDAADVYAQQVRFSIWETDLLVQTPMGRLQIITPLIGRPNAYNVLACVAAAISINIDLTDIVSAIENAEVVPGRFEIIDEGQDFSVVVDYAHTPDALNQLLDTVRECNCRRILLVFGCGGDRDAGKRPYMGEIAHYKADIVILTNDNPRTEAPDAIIQDIVSGFPEEITQRHPNSVYNYLQDVGRVPSVFEEELLEWQGEVKRYVMEDRFSAIRAAIGTAQKNDVVVIAGKGHEDYIEYCDIDGNPLKAWFDDRVEARNALSKLPYLQQIPYLDRKNLPWQRTA